MQGAHDSQLQVDLSELDLKVILGQPVLSTT